MLGLPATIFFIMKKFVFTTMALGIPPCTKVKEWRPLMLSNFSSKINLSWLLLELLGRNVMPSEKGSGYTGMKMAGAE